MMEQAVRAQAEAAKEASYALAVLRSDVRDAALHAMAAALTEHAAEILHENAADVADAEAAGVRASYIDRLRLTSERIHAMAEGLRLTAALPDPLGREDYAVRRPNGLEIHRVRVPLGVVGMIYEARPNVTADAIGLCLKSGNAVLLRGGSDALRSNAVIADVLSRAAYAAGIPVGAVQMLAMKERSAVDVMTHLTGLLDVLIPRGGAGLIRHIVESSSVPVIETGSGICHIYVDRGADLTMACRIVRNAKVSRPSVCNAAETVMLPLHFCRRWQSSCVPMGWSCAAAQRRVRFSATWLRQRRRTGRRSTVTSSSPSMSLRTWMPHCGTSIAMGRGIPRRL